MEGKLSRASIGSAGDREGWGVLGSPGGPGQSWKVLGGPGKSWGVLGSPGGPLCTDVVL